MLINMEMGTIELKDCAPTSTHPQMQQQRQQQHQQNHSPGRSVGSLVQLTQKFVNLMKQNNGHIDLKKATDILQVQKRRIYDITNVLEGVGLIEKTRHSSVVRWKGEFGDNSDREDLGATLSRTNHLIALEADLDIQLEYARRNLKYIKEDPTNKSYAYVTRDDLLSTFGDDTIFTIPNHDEEVVFHKAKDSLHVSLDNGSTIDARLVTNQGECIASKPALESVMGISRLETPSPSLSPSSPPTIKMASHSNLVTAEHTYFRKPEIREEMSELDNELTARIIFKSSTTGHSLRRFFPDNPNLDNAPLVQLNPPKNDYTFVLQQDEGVCELFDIPCNS